MTKPYQFNYQSVMLRLVQNFLLLFFLFLAASSIAQNFPAGFSQVQVVNGISNPTVMAFTPDGRIFIAEQGGRLRVVKNGSLLPTPFVQLSVNASGERGLIGITLDPNFSSNGYVYLYHTLPDASRNRISRFTANGDVALTGSQVVVLDLDPLSSANNHNGGAMHFGTDGKLYVAIGDNANRANAQNLDTYHGKLLRINPNGSVPADNPYTTGSEQRRRVWAHGLRNPYTFDVRSGTGKVYVNDVGENTWEEINDATTGGQNFGWPSVEGNSTNPSFANPVYAYSHGLGDGRGCAITGGVFFTPASTNYPSTYTGAYFYQDLCNAWINYLTFDGSGNPTRHPFATSLPGQSLALDMGTDGNLYYLSRNAGALYRIVYTPSNPPVITSQPSNVSVSQGQNATFTVIATGTTPLNYQWRKNGVNISGANSASYTITNVQPSHAGQYNVVVNNSFGSVASSNATLTVTSFNAPPVATITSPGSNATYTGGQTISFSGTATDPEDGNLPASAFSWALVFHHDTHVHDGPPIADGTTSGSFTIPNSGEISANVFYRLHLIVRDSQGLLDSAFVDIRPVKIQLSFATQPEGLRLMLDGQSVTTPFLTTAVAGIQRTIGVVSPQTVSGITYVFDGWLHGGSATQTISTPSTNTTYTAVFREETLREPENPANTAAGLEYAYYEGSWNSLPNFSSLTPVKIGVVGSFNLDLRDRNDNFAFNFQGFIEIPTDGVYTFYTNSDDGSKLYIGSTEVVNNDGLHGVGEVSGTIGMRAGKHAIRVSYFERTGNQVLNVRYQGPGISKREIPSSVLFRATFDDLRNPENPTNTVAGLDYEYFEGTWNNVPIFSFLPVAEVGTVSNFNLSPRNRNDNFAFRFSGYIEVPTDGIYTFYTSSDDGSRLQIGASLVVYNDGLHVTTEESGAIGLKAGKHAIQVSYFERTGNQALTVSYQGPGITKREIPASVLFRFNDPAARIASESFDMENGLSELSMYPNPASSQLYLKFISEEAGEVAVSLLDLTGKRVKELKHNAIAGGNELSLNLAGINSGIYQIVLSGNKMHEIRKLVVDR